MTQKRPDHRYHWRMRNGTRIYIPSMNDDHLVNTLRGLSRRMNPRAVGWFYVAWWLRPKKEVLRDFKALHELMEHVYNYVIKRMLHFTDDPFGEQTQKDLELLTVMREEAAYRGLDWWDHDGRCDCEPCEGRRQRAREFYENNPNYKKM